jgi:hypothetical protein
MRHDTWLDLSPYGLRLTLMNMPSLRKHFVVTEVEGHAGSLESNMGNLAHAGFERARAFPAAAMPETVPVQLVTERSKAHGIRTIAHFFPKAVEVPFSKADHERTARLPLRIVSPPPLPEAEASPSAPSI